MANNGFAPVNDGTSTITVGPGAAVAHTFTALQLGQTVFFITPSVPLAAVLHIRARLTGDTDDADANDTVIPPNNALPLFRDNGVLSISVFNPTLSSVNVIISAVVPRG